MSRILLKLLVKKHAEHESWCVGLGWGKEERGHGLSQGCRESEIREGVSMKFCLHLNFP